MPVGENRNSLFIGDFEYTLSDRLDNLEIIDGALPEFLTPIPNLALSKDASMSFECDVNAPLFEQLFGVDLALGGDRVSNMTLRFEYPYLVQVRKHRKKRINKKWAKRYGFKYMFKVVDLEDVEIENHDGEIDILGKEFVVR